MEIEALVGVLACWVVCSVGNEASGGAVGYNPPYIFFYFRLVYPIKHIGRMLAFHWIRSKSYSG